MKKFWKNIGSKLYAFIITIVFVSAGFSSLILIRNAPKKDEQINIYIEAYNCNKTLLDSKLNNKNIEGIRNIEIYYNDVNSGFFNKNFGAWLNVSDILIMPESRLGDGCKRLFYSLDNTEYLERKIDIEKFEYFVNNDSKYGIKYFSSNDFENREYLDLIGDNENREDYFLLINKNCLTAGEIGNNDSNI